MAVNNFIDLYKTKLIKSINSIDNNVLQKIIHILDETQQKNSRIYVLGNGGSSATASHMVNDLGVGLKRRGIRNFNIVSLADNTPVCTAIANDIGYDNIFFMQLKDVLEKDDILIAISCSGNSPNIIKAVEYAKNIGSIVIGLTGFDGGRLKQLSDINFHVDADIGDYGLVEDLHMILDHIIYSYYISQNNT